MQFLHRVLVTSWQKSKRCAKLRLADMLFDDPNKLSNEEIRKRLAGAGINGDLIDSIIEQFWFHDWGNSFLSFPKHLEALIGYLTTKENKSFSRYEFYAFYFIRKLHYADKTFGYLCKVGMVFEMMQTDRLPIAAFEALLKERDCPKELTQEALVKENFLFLEKDKDQYFIRWTHHTLGEFLAAEYIRSYTDMPASFEKFLSNSSSGVITFIPSWGGVLRFLLESESVSVIEWISSCRKANPGFLSDTLMEILVFETPTSISNEYKLLIFDIVYGTYQRNKWWVPTWAYHRLTKFVEADSYRLIKLAANDKDFIIRGNVAAVVDGMLLHQNSLLKGKEKQFWKKKLIEYANDKNTNGVLQRHALAALGNFRGQSDIIDQVLVSAKSNDSLVREAFIRMCASVDPNSDSAIACFVAAIADDTAHIYARHALENITTREGIQRFLQQIVKSDHFIHEFLDQESIFNRRGKATDAKLIENIQKNVSTKDVSLLQDILLKALTTKGNYHTENSYFLKQIALIIKSLRPHYLLELIQIVNKLPQNEQEEVFINGFQGIMSVLLTPDMVKGINEKLNANRYGNYVLTDAIRLAVVNDNPDGKAVLAMGIGLGIIENPELQKKYDTYQVDRNKKIYKQFQEYLSPGKETSYFPQVFNWYIDNQIVLDEFVTVEEKERLLKVAVEWNLNKIDPATINVRFEDKKTKSGQYSITEYGIYFADVLKVIHLLKPEVLELPQNKKKIISYIPFIYLSDFDNLSEIVGTVTDSDLEPVNAIMLDKTKDARYLVPQTYVYLAETKSGLTTPKKVLLSLVEDEKVTGHEREYALKTLKKYISSSDTEVKMLLAKLWNKNKRDSLSDLSNALLISVFHDSDAVKWRFQVIKKSAKPFRMAKGVHEVGALESELHSMAFAAPILDLKDEKYMSEIIKLLNFSLTIVEKKDHWDYVNYIWRIAIGYVVRDSFILSQEALQMLYKWFEKNKAVENLNWFNKRLEQSALETSQAFGKVHNVESALKKLN